MLAFQIHADSTTQKSEITLETRHKTFDRITDVTLNDLPVMDFADIHEGIEAGQYDLGSTDHNATFFIDLPSDEPSITIGYYEGTQYQELTLDGTLPYYTFDPNAAIPAFLTLTKEGYAVLDTSLLMSGMKYALGWSAMWPYNAAIFSVTD